MFEAKLKSRSQPKLGALAVTFPIPEERYENVILALQNLQIGDAGKQDCCIDSIRAPDCPRDPPEPLVCSDYERCQHCNYMAHGFQCDHGNGSCVLTDMEEINGRRRVLVQSIAGK